MNTHPRIAFIANNWYVPWGGSEELWSLAALHLHRTGVPVLACVQNWRPRPARLLELERAGVAMHTIRPVRAMRAREAVRARWRRTRTRSLQQYIVQESIEPFRPDLVVISQMQNLDGQAWANALRDRHVPYAMLSQAASEYGWPNDALWEAARRAYAGSAGSFFVCRQNLELTERELAMALPNAELVHNPFVVRYEQPTVWPDTQDVWKVACVARLEPAAKGQDLLFELLSAPKWRERSLQLSLYGGGVNEASLRALAAHYQLACVRFHGHTNDVEAIWREHQALVLPSRSEGTPLALIEAMLCHRPAIVTPVGGNADLVQDGESGFVAQAVSLEAIDAALERAWQQRREWREMGLAAGRRVRAIVPPDPAAAFAARVTAIAGTGSQRRAS